MRLAFNKRPAAPTPVEPLDTRAFDWMCLSVAMLIAVHASHLPLWLSPVLAVLLALRWWQRRRTGRGVPGWLKLPLLALLTLAIMRSYGTLIGREPGTALALGLLVLKLLESESARDARVAMGFACFALMSALLIDQSLLMTATVTLGLLPTLAALRALEPAQGSGTWQPRELIPVLGLLLCALPLALFAFLLVPRLSSPLWGASNAPQTASGLSDTMSPGNFTDLLTDDSPAMRVTFDGAPPPNNRLYFRAYILWDYDGRDWSQGEAWHQQQAPLEAGPTISYRVSLEPTHLRALPALDVPVAAPAHAQLRPDRELIAEKPLNDPLQYKVRSALTYHLQTKLPAEQRNRALRLPTGFNPHMLALAGQWRRRHGSNAIAIAETALALFHDGGFSYTLAPPELGRDAMDEFLFDTRRGFCEHYASAFVLLMRAAGIPARVVTGYQGGYWNALGDYLLVRRSDAHAWAEVWLAGRGWVRFDPTAAVRPERISLGADAAAGDQLAWYQNGWLESWRNRWDIVNRWWNQGVIGFDSIRQRGLLTPFGIKDLDVQTMEILLLNGIALSAALGLFWAMRQPRATDPLQQAMAKVERRLARHGVIRRSSEGPQHYFQRAARALPGHRERLLELMDCYLECRYAYAEPPSYLLHRFRRLAREFMGRRVVKSNTVGCCCTRYLDGDGSMSPLNRTLTVITASVALASCATMPQPLTGTYANVTTLQAQQGGANGSQVRWGGEIIKTEPGAQETCFYLLARPLDSQGRPTYESKGESQGRFVACRAGFYDPEVFSRGRELTVTGPIQGLVSKKVGEYDYAYPRVAANVVYLWPKRQIANYPPGFYDPFWGPYWGGPWGPYWGGGWGGGFYGYGQRVIIAHPHPQPHR